MTLQHFKDLLHSRNLKATNSRLQLLKHMQDYSTAIPYSEIQSAMKSIDRVTLYRTLDTLIEQGIVHQAYRDNNECYYALCGKKCSKVQHHHEHIHFKCKNCMLVTCQELTDKIEISLPQCEVHKISIHAEGICKTCKQKMLDKADE